MNTICPYCRQPYEVDDEFNLQKGVCENCGKHFIIQEESFERELLSLQDTSGNTVSIFPQYLIYHCRYNINHPRTITIPLADILAFELWETEEALGRLTFSYYESLGTSVGTGLFRAVFTIYFQQSQLITRGAREIKDYIQNHFSHCQVEYKKIENCDLPQNHKAGDGFIFEYKKLKEKSITLAMVYDEKIKELQKLKAQNETLKSRNEELKTENDTFKLKNGELKTKNDSLQNANKVLEKERDELKDTLLSEFVKYDDLKDECQRLEEEQAHSISVKPFDCITNSNGFEINICDRTERDWEKSPCELIQIISESIPEKLIPPSGFPNFYLTNTLLHSVAVKNEKNGANFNAEEQENFFRWNNNGSWALVTFKKPNNDVYLALGTRFDKRATYSVPIEFTILEMIGRCWQYANGYHDNDEILQEYTCFCFLNYIRSNPIGYYQPFSTEFIQQKQREAQSYLQTKHYFKWPDTIIIPRSLTGTPVDERNWPQEGMLKHKGYSVGSSSNVTRWKRQIILRDVYENPLPNVMDSDYMAQWGRPQSAKRLKKMAESLAAFTKNAKRKRSQGNFDVAIADWEEDLAWLKKEFYDGVYNRIFPWPNLKV